MIKEIFFNTRTQTSEIIERELTLEEVHEIENQKTLKEKQERIGEIKLVLEELTKDFAQDQAGLEIDNIEEKKKQFRDLHTELRELLGKEPRKIKSFDKVE